jgi:hypothetical protein
MPRERLRDPHLAGALVGRIENWIAGCEKNLKPTEQLRVTALLPGDIRILVTFIGYRNPDLVALDGINLSTGRGCALLLHQDLLQLLCEFESLAPNEPRRKIGFQTTDEENADAG